MIRGTLEGGSNFEIKGRPFDTRAASLGLGPGVFVQWKRLLFSLQSLVVFRYWEVVRADLPDPTAVCFADMGVGLMPSFSLTILPWLGLYGVVGAELFPRARTVEVENGPHKRIGLFHFPFNAGLFVQF